jgi:hypothetical protein
MMMDSENYYSLASEEALRRTTQGDALVSNTLETQVNRPGLLQLHQQPSISDQSEQFFNSTSGLKDKHAATRAVNTKKEAIRDLRLDYVNKKD